MPIANANIVFGFNIHHIIPRELFTNPITAATLNNLFANQPNGLSLNMRGNRIALYSDPPTAAACPSSEFLTSRGCVNQASIRLILLASLCGEFALLHAPGFKGFTFDPFHRPAGDAQCQ